MFDFLKKPNVTDLVKDIESDVLEFVQNEMILYHSNPDNAQRNSVIANMALFDLSSLLTEKGYSQMVNLFGDSHGQLVGRRIRQLRHTLYIRYGKPLREVEKRSIAGMAEVYDLRKEDVEIAARRIPGLWLIPFIRRAYDATEIEMLSFKKK